MLKRIVGVTGISLWIAMSFYSICSLFAGSSLELYWFFIPLFSSIVLLTACIALYSVNKTLWDSVHNAHEKKDGILCVIPDLYLIVDFIECVGKIR